jgi:dihydropteroate synthase
MVNGRALAGDGMPRIMGILNVTPDSFSDGGRYLDPSAAIDRAHRLVAEGADLLDVGGESTRPGSLPVAAAEQLRRILPVIEASVRLGVPISVDTSDPLVARHALAAGAQIINDVRGLRDPALRTLVAETQASAVVMHMQGDPEIMQRNPHYNDVVTEVRDWLQHQVEQAVAAGIPRTHLAIDPGIGFGKTTAHNLALIRQLDALAPIGCAILVGTSRKRFLGELTGRDLPDRLVPSVVSALAALARGASIVRVHDVAATRDALQTWHALQPTEPLR